MSAELLLATPVDQGDVVGCDRVFRNYFDLETFEKHYGSLDGPLHKDALNEFATTMHNNFVFLPPGDENDMGLRWDCPGWHNRGVGRNSNPLGINPSAIHKFPQQMSGSDRDHPLAGIKPREDPPPSEGDEPKPYGHNHGNESGPEYTSQPPDSDRYHDDHVEFGSDEMDAESDSAASAFESDASFYSSISQRRRISPLPRRGLSPSYSRASSSSSSSSGSPSPGPRRTRSPRYSSASDFESCGSDSDSDSDYLYSPLAWPGKRKAGTSFFHKSTKKAKATRPPTISIARKSNSANHSATTSTSSEFTPYFHSSATSSATSLPDSSPPRAPVCSSPTSDNPEVPSQETVWACPHSGCSQVCKSAGDLGRHLESLAHKERSYLCGACTQRFTRVDALRRHHRNKAACRRVVAQS